MKLNNLAAAIFKWIFPPLSKFNRILYISEIVEYSCTNEEILAGDLSLIVKSSIKSFLSALNKISDILHIK